MKKFLLLAALVLLPAVALIIVATRSAADRDMLLTQLVQNQAAGTLQRTGAAFSKSLNQLAHTVCDTLDAAIRGGQQATPPSVAAQSLSRRHPLIKSVYLYSHPWGFSPLDPEAPAPPTSLELELQEAASLPPHLQRPYLILRSEGNGYCFVKSPRMNGLYAGYLINQEAVPEQFIKLFREHDQIGLACRISHLGSLPDMAGTNILLLVSDTLTPAGASAPEASSSGTPTPPEQELGILRLPFPCGAFTAHAFSPMLTSHNPLFKQWETRLYGWGIVILALTLCAATTLFILQAAASARTAERQTRFVMGVSHDLRTPVTAVRTLAESIYYGHVSSRETERKFLSTIVHECDRLTTLLERVLFFVRQDQQRLKLNRSPVDTVAMVHHELEVLKERNGERIHASVTTNPDVPRAKADPEGLATVIRNLLDNARKYGADASGHVHISVNISAARRHGRAGVALSFADTGPGVPRHEQRLIFQKYYRAHAPGLGHVGGIGLGLALIRSIIRAHRGTISLTSRHGEGATFRIWLPAAAHTARPAEPQSNSLYLHGEPR